MKERVKILNQKLNDYIVKNNLESYLVFINIGLFYDLARNLKEALKDFYFNNKISINKNDITRLTIFEKLEIVKQFYKEYNIDLNIDKYIQNGTIDFIENNIDEKPFNIDGITYYEGTQRLIDSNNNGVVGDIPNIVHEIGHFRNMPIEGRTQLGGLLTESLARTEELLVLDYLEKLGYIEEVRQYKIYLYRDAYKTAGFSEIFFKLLLLFKELGDISLESYEMYFKETKDYDRFINNVERIIRFNEELRIPAKYMLDTYISSYLYLKYKEDNSFIKNINQLHSLINSKDMFDCLKLIGLNDLGEEDQEILLNSVKKMIEQITKEETKTK